MITFRIDEPKFLAKLAVLKKFAKISKEKKMTLVVNSKSATLNVYSFSPLRQQLSFKLADIDCDLENLDDYEMSLFPGDIRRLRSIDWSAPVECQIDSVGLKPRWILITPDLEKANGSTLVLISCEANDPYTITNAKDCVLNEVKGRIIVDAVHFQVACKSTSATLSNDDTRVAIQCAHVEQIDEVTMRVVSTDGHRMTLRTFSHKNVQPLPFPINIPGAVWSTLTDASYLAPAMMNFYFDYDLRQTTTPENYMMMRTVIGKFEYLFETSSDCYPIFRKVLPNNTDCVVVDFGMIAFRNALMKHRYTVGKKFLGFKMEIQKARIVITSCDGEVQFTTSVELSNPSPFMGTVAAGFNWKYMMNATVDCKTMKLVFKCYKDNFDMLLSSIEDISGQQINFIMPMRI